MLKRVLIIENDEESHRRYRDLFPEKTFSLTCFHTINQALIPYIKERFDLVLIHSGLSRTNFLEFIKMSKSMKPEVPVVVYMVKHLQQHDVHLIDSIADKVIFQPLHTASVAAIRNEFLGEAPDEKKNGLKLEESEFVLSC